MTDMTVDVSATVVEGATAPAPRSWGRLLRAAMRFWRTRIGVALVVAIVGIAIVGALVASSPTAIVGPPFSSPGEGHVAGTDNLGRDVLARFLHGGLSVIGMALAATILGVSTGVALGLVAANSRRSVDEWLMRITDVFLAFPPIILALLVVSLVGAKVWLLVLTVAITHAPRVARLARGAALEVIHRDFVMASEAVGESRLRILFRGVLPNIASPLLVDGGLRLTYSIGTIAALSFIGFGIQPPQADWGLMINENRNALSIEPWPVVLPVIAIAILTIGTNLIVDGVGRALVGIDRGKGDA